MALNREFKIKNDLNVLGKILSGGTDLIDIFSQATASFKVSAANTNTSFFVSGGDAFTLEGKEGITLFADNNTESLVISGVNATTSSKGVASFDNNNFTVTHGQVSIAANGVSKTNLADGSVGKDEIDASDIVDANGAIYFTNANGFSANVDSRGTIGINSSNQLYVPTGGIGNNEIDDNAVTKSKIADSAVGKSEIDSSDIVYNFGAINFTNNSGFSARTDNSTIGIDPGNNHLFLKSVPANVPITIYSNGGLFQNPVQGLSARVDNTSIVIDGENNIAIKEMGVTGRLLNSDIVDNLSLEVSNSGPFGNRIIKVRNSGIYNSLLANSAVDKVKINAENILANNSGLTFNNFNGLSANVDKTTIHINGNNDLEVISLPLSAVTGNIVNGGYGGISYSPILGLSANVDNSTIELSRDVALFPYRYLQVKDYGITNTKLQYSTINFSDATATYFPISLGAEVNFDGTAFQIETDASTAGKIKFSLPSLVSIPGDLFVHNGQTSVRDLSVGGNLFVAGSATFQNTLVTTSSALSVINSGPTPALFVKNTNVDHDIASFYDGDNIEVLHIGGGGVGGGSIGINVGTPGNGSYQPDLVGLTVAGNISASEVIYTLNYGTSIDWYSTYTTVKVASGDWESTYSVVQSLSDTWGFGGGSGTIVQTYSADWNSAYTTVNTNSATWLKEDTNIRVTGLEVDNGTQSVDRKVFTNTILNNAGTVPTFNNANATTIKYVVNIRRGYGSPAKRCAMEVLAIKKDNDITWEGTVYGILDTNDLLDYSGDPVNISVVDDIINLDFNFSSSDSYYVTIVGDAISGH
jgi:hypothetical protein